MILNSSLCRCLAAACGLLVCTSAPASDYLEAPVPTEWGSGLPAMAEGNIQAEWWRSFDDPLLDSLIAIGLANNYDLSAAARRIEVARNTVRQEAAAWFPQLGIDAGWQRERISGRTEGRNGASAVQSYFSASASMNWEVDVFGKVRAKVKNARASQAVTAAEYDAVLLALQAEIATAYISLLANRSQLDVANEHSANQKHILDITETRYRTGLVSKLDVAQARTLYYSTIASIPMLESAIEASYNALGVLLGTGREGLPAGIFTAKTMPAHYVLPPLGTPLDLLRRRPDIIEAERSIDVAASALGIVRKEYLPSLSLSASAGTAAHNIGDLFSRPSLTYSVAPTLSWTLFDGLSRRAADLSAQRSLEIAVDNYNMTVLTAVEEVRNALARYTATLKYIGSIEKVVENSEESVRLSLDQYKQGLTDFYNVVEAQLNYLTYQNSLVESRGNALTSLVSLYKALGGTYQ